MEILGTLGYSGESIEFISPETICYSSGNGLCVIETNKGPKDIIWRSEKGIQCWSSHQVTNQIIIAPKIDGGFLTLYSLTTSQVIANLTNPAGGKIIHFSFSGDGTYLLALSDSTDHKVIMWNVTTYQVLFSIDLPSNCEKCLMHPADNLSFLLYGSESILYCHILEILGNYDVKMYPIMIKMESKYSSSSLPTPTHNSSSTSANITTNSSSNSNSDEPEYYQGITCATWSPPANLIVGTYDGSIFVIEPISKYTKKLFSIPSKPSDRIEFIQPISLVLIGVNLIIGIGKCQVLWYSFDPFDLTSELLENETHFQEIISAEPDQILTLESDNDNIPQSLASISSFEITGDTHYLTCLVCDTSDYLSCIASTSDGMIYKFSSEIQHLTNDDDVDDEGHEQVHQQQNQKPVLLSYSPLYTLHSGTIIATHTMSLPISEYASSQGALNTKNDGVVLNFDHAESVAVIITGSYTGAVSFWRILGPNDHGSNVTNSTIPSTQTKSTTGIVKSVPRIPQRLCRKYVCEKVELENDITAVPHVITAFETLSLATYGGGRLLVVGTMTGWIEIWRVEGYINEDTRPDDNVGNENALDEEDALRDITIGIQLVYRRRFYETAITSISSSDAMSCFAISSYDNHLIYVLNTSPKNKFQDVKVYTLGDNTNKPVNISWNGPLLWVPTHEGIFFTFLPEFNQDDTIPTISNNPITTTITTNNNNNNTPDTTRGNGSLSPNPNSNTNANTNTNDDEVLKITPVLAEMTPIHPKVMWEVDSKTIGNASPLNGSGGGCMFTKQDISMIGLIDNYPTIFDLEHNNLLHSDYPLGEVPEVPMLQMPGNLKYSIPMSSPIISLAKAPNTQLVATGTLDGSIFLWKVKRGEISLINRYQPHCCAVINLLFTIDSSQVISSGVDGSVFITLVDKPVQLNIPVVSLLLENDLFDMKQLGTVSSRKMLWKDQHHQEVMNQLKETFKSKSIHFQSIVENIENRLKTLLTRNQDANELEKMDLSEFVIDVKRKEEIINNNNQKANKVREMYELKNSVNELIAARIRQQCWDTMEVHSITILPIQDNIKDLLTSYSIEKYTEVHRLKLERIKRLRAIEITSQRITLQSKGGGHIDKVGTGGNWRCCWGKNVQGTPNIISWLFNDGNRWPCQDIIKLILEQEKNNNSSKDNSEGGNNSSTGQGINSSPIKEIKDDKKKGVSNVSGNKVDKLNSSNNPTTTTITGVGGVAATSSGIVGTSSSNNGNNNNNNNNNGTILTQNINIINSRSHNGDEDDENSYSGDMITLEQEIDFNNIFNLLYAPQTVRTQIQKRNQIIFLKEIIRLIKLNFNKYFDKLYHEKEDVMINIQSKNTRINEIINELEIIDDGSGINPKWNDIELPDSTIRVLDNEISSRPYETNAMKLQRLAEEERKRKEAEERNNDGKERALNDMMNGTLEVKRDVLSEASSLQKPEWMNTTSYEHMTDSQKKEFEEYQARYNAIQDERAKYRKSLEIEMKKLKVEIQDIVKGFDDKLLQMIKLKILIQREILANELYISRLALSMVKREQCWVMLKDVEKEIEKTRLKRIEVSTKIDKLTAATEEAKVQLTNFQDEEKVLDRSFKRDLQTLCNTTFDQDLLKLFTQLYRLRKYQETGFLSNEEDSDHITGTMDGRSSRNSTKRRMSLKRSMGSSKGQSRGVTHRRSKGNSVSNRGDSLGPMQTAAKEILEQEAGLTKQPTINVKNPFYSNLIAQDREKKIQESQLPLLQPLSIDVDTPEGFSIDPFVWSKLQELRLNRISKEIAVKGQLKTYTELKKKLEILTNEEDEIHTTAIQLRKKRENILERMKELMDDLEIIISVKQGQDEVDSDVVVTDYNQSKLIPTSIIQKYNNRINELGKEKINILSKIKQFRRKMNLVDWEAKHLQLEGWHLEEYYTDSQLFRVTRDLQRIIKDGINYELNKNKYDKILIRKEFIKKDSENKINKMHQLIENIKLQMTERVEENSKLSAKINILQGEVAVREQVIRASTAGGNDDNDHNNTNNTGLKTSDDILLSKTAPLKSTKIDVKMKKIVKRRKLIDTARIQSEEIDYLKQELDKLRQKTFPSFVRSTRNRLIYNPDERI